MNITTTKDSIFIFIGDLIFFIVGLWLTLLIRNLEMPSFDLFLVHLVPFIYIFLVWSLGFFLFDLYGKQTIVFKHKLPGALIRAQLTNSFVAFLFFYFIPYFGITPRTILFINLFITFALVFLWRWYVSNTIYKGEQERALVVGEGQTVDEIKNEISENLSYHIEIVNKGEVVPLDPDVILEKARDYEASTIVLNLSDPKTDQIASGLYKLFFMKFRFIDLASLYEELFDRVSLELISDRWLLENVTDHRKDFYMRLKRAMDIIVSLVLGTLSLPIIFVAGLLVKLGDNGSVFFIQERVGKDGELINIIKLRTMTTTDSDKPTLKEDPRITPIGSFLRKTRIDELPQFWNILKGDLSLIGPRPEVPHFVKQYREEINYYDVRHLIRPGVSGWAQIHYHTPAYSAATNAVKLAYELYYLKNRSIALDIKIALKTIRTLVSRKGI